MKLCGRLSVHHFLHVPNIGIRLPMHLNIFKVHYKHDIFVINLNTLDCMQLAHVCDMIKIETGKVVSI